MKKLMQLVFVLIPCFVLGQTKPKTNPEMKRFVYQTKSSIEKRPYDSLYFDINYVSGSNWVFKYSYKSQETEMIADDEYFESYEFEIPPPKGNSFVIESKDFDKCKVVFTRSCFCPDAGLRQLKEGTIKGKRIKGNTWLVTFDVMIIPRPGREGLPISKTLKGYFKPGKLMYD